jgi:hypothetical protein
MLFSALLATIITCNEAIVIIDRLSKVVGLSYHQKMEIIQTIQEYIPTCPIAIEQNGKVKNK